MEKTISSLNYQLGKIEELIKKDLKNKTFIYNFFVNEDSEKLLDLDSLIDFLSQTTIAKTLFLSSIVKKCMRIIDYWNNDSFELEKEELYSYYNESTGVFVNSQSKFHCIVLKPFEWEFLNTESELNYFFDNYNYKIYSIQQIAKRCTIIINWITANYPETMPDETKKEIDKPETFEELFYNPDLVIPCINVLKELDPPLIDTDCNYIGKLKGAICVWIDELQRQGIVKRFSDRKILASLIEKKIKRFTIDDSMFGKYHDRAEKQYKTEIKSMVSKIKLSQDSQNSH